MPNLDKNDKDFFNFLPKRENWKLNLSKAILSKDNTFNILINFARQLYQLFSNAIKDGSLPTFKSVLMQNWIDLPTKQSFFLELEINWLLSVKVAILRILSPDFTAIKLHVKSKQEVSIAVRYLKKIPNLKGLWLNKLEEENLVKEWAQLRGLEYLFLKGCTVDANSVFIENFKKSPDLKKISFGISYYFRKDGTFQEAKSEDEKQLNRLKKIKSTDISKIYIGFPAEHIAYSHNLKLLKYISDIAGLNVREMGQDCNIILFPKYQGAWFDSYKNEGFHSYITEFELKEWIFELLDVNLDACDKESNFEPLLDFFNSNDKVNILIALNILLHHEGINETMFSVVVAVYQNYLSVDNNNEYVTKIINLSEEVILKYIPLPILMHFKKLKRNHLEYNGSILKIEILQFFKNFNINESQIQKCLLFNKKEKYLYLLIDFDKNEELPHIFENLKTYPISFVSISFFGKGNIVPTINKIVDCLENIDNLSLTSLNAARLNIGHSTGSIQYQGKNLSIRNFYCDNKASIKFLNVQTLMWTQGGDLMSNLGDCFPKLEDLTIHRSILNNFNIYKTKSSLLKLNFSMSLWKESFNKNLSSLSNLKYLSITNCGLTMIPKEVLLLKKVETLSFAVNNITEFPTMLEELQYLEELTLILNEITELPREIKFTKLKKLELGHNKVKYVNIPLKECPELHNFSLGFNKVTELHSTFINQNLERDVTFYFSNNGQIKLPNINQITIPVAFCRAIFHFQECNIDEKIITDYTNKYPKSFKFKF
jgi:Leucine-rich repeat (LRR) protein